MVEVLRPSLPTGFQFGLFAELRMCVVFGSIWALLAWFDAGTFFMLRKVEAWDEKHFGLFVEFARGLYEVRQLLEDGLLRAAAWLVVWSIIDARYGQMCCSPVEGKVHAARSLGMHGRAGLLLCRAWD
ncbi:hypothetical protein L7F22_066608 [Adiantum nelumboides]|nr:hypothetical protein [Adiantum nelumboides]